MEGENFLNRGSEAILNLEPNSSVAISYHPLFGSHDDIMLLEVDEKLLQEVLHQRVVVRGQPNEDAVLCSQSKTYSMKFVGTSNSVFLVPPSDQPEFSHNLDLIDQKDQTPSDTVSVIKVAAGTMELVEVAPRLDKLKNLLFKRPLRSEEDMEIEGRYTWDDLVNEVQASDDELRSGLDALSAIEIDGYWRVVDEKYMDVILRMVLNNSVLNDWSLDALNQDCVVEALRSDGFRRELAEHCLRVYGQKVVNREGVDFNRLWKLDEKRVCVHFAREILRNGKKKSEVLMEELSKKIPEGMRASFEMLEGEVLTERFGVETWVRLFSVSSLPLAPSERFSILFKERQKWEWKDLEPFIRVLKVPGLTSEGLLLKYTRRTQPKADSEPIFSAR